MKRKVYLDGELGERFGKELTMNVNSFAEVFRCLEANYPEVREYLIECHEKNIGFTCEVGETPLTTDEELILKFGKGDMYITPVPAGSKKGITKIFAAIIIAVAVFYLGPAGTIGLLGETAATIGYTFAASLALQGIQQIMAPDPSTDTNQQDESYLFQGTGQTILEGDPVPLLYGRLRVPGRPISFHVKNEHQRFYNEGNTKMDSTEDNANPVMEQDSVTGGTSGDNNDNTASNAQV